MILGVPTGFRQISRLYKFLTLDSTEGFLDRSRSQRVPQGQSAKAPGRGASSTPSRHCDRSNVKRKRPSLIAYLLPKTGLSGSSRGTLGKGRPESMSLEIEVRKHWDIRARRLGQRPSATGWGGHLRRIEAREILRAVPSAGAILDAGCGNAYVLNQLVRSLGESRLIGLDLSREMLSLARERLKGSVELVEASVTFLPFRSGSLQCLYSIRTMIFVPRGKRDAAIGEAMRVLKSAGLLVLIECTVEGIRNLNRLRCRLGIPGLLEHPQYFFEQEELEAALRKSGSEILRRIHFPMMSIMEKVFYPKVARIRGSARLFSVIYRLTYPVDRVLCRHFPTLGYDVVYIVRMHEEQPV